MEAIKNKLKNSLESTQMTFDEKLKQICYVLDTSFEYYNWTGFYFKDPNKDELVLSQYVGAATDHIRIPFGKGICGQVAVLGETFVVEDVYKQDNYLACSIETKSEIVVPIYNKGKNIGQIDIDSHTPNAFTQKDKDLLEWLCDEIGKIM